MITQVPVLGGIAFDPAATKNPLLTDGSGHAQRAESFRQLRTNLQFAHVSHKSKTVLVTSSLPGEGKTSTATNLAIAMAESGQTVALVDADLRRPMVATYLGLEGQAGLTTALIGLADVQDLMQPWGKNELHVLASGRIPPNPSELLGSVEMKQLIERLEGAFDAVVIDAPPLLPVTDAAVLAQQVGGVLMVIGCHSAKRPTVEKAFSTLKLVDADVLGVVLNRVPTKGADAYSYNYYGYISNPADTGQQKPPVPKETDAEPGDAFDEILQGRSTRRANQDRG
ncbi:CpsD/CapB family tyrosine-protein kinase [Arthrobacter sp. HLT1-20]